MFIYIISGQIIKLSKVKELLQTITDSKLVRKSNS